MLQGPACRFPWPFLQKPRLGPDGLKMQRVVSEVSHAMFRLAYEYDAYEQVRF